MKKTTSILATMFAAGALLVFAADVHTDYDHHADWAKYHTYSWIGVKAGNSLWQDRIQNAVDSALTSRGWQKVPNGGDAAVAAMGRTQNEQTMETFYDGFGGGWFWRGFGDGMATTQVINQPVGTLNVDVFDSGTKKLIWRGTSQKTLSGNPDKNEHKLDDSVNDMFKHFPPKERG